MFIFRYRFTSINLTAPGRSHDSRVFEDSCLKEQHAHNQIFYKNSKTIESVQVPMLLLGDGAYRLTKFLMKPYPHKAKKTVAQARFNYYLSRTRRVIENTYGHFIGRWRILSKREYLQFILLVNNQ